VIDLSNEDVVVDELAEEVACLKICDHKNIVRFYGCFKDDEETLFVSDTIDLQQSCCCCSTTWFIGRCSTFLQIAMELLKKAADELYMDTNQPLKESQLQLILKGLVQALEYLHNKPIMHRDIKGMHHTEIQCDEGRVFGFSYVCLLFV
jgi:serine/threonine protein kinase